MENTLISRRFEKLCIKAASGNISAEEKALLDRWRASSKDNETCYAGTVSLWSSADPPDFAPQRSAEAAWKDLAARISRPEKVKTGRFEKLKNKAASLAPSMPRYRLHPAFAGLIVVLAVLGSWRLLTLPSGSGQAASVSTKNRQKTEITLVDGSTVHLNCGSTLTYSGRFGRDSREVFLTGEAFFKVARNGRPFTVMTENARTTVLGTEFSVKARGAHTRVIVKEGCVRLETETEEYDAGSNVILTADQTSEIAGLSSPEPPASIDAELALGWLEGKLAFEKIPFAEILSDLERAYDVTIVLTDSSFGKRTLTAAFADESIETVLTSLCLSLGVSYEEKQNIYRISE